MSDTSFLSRLLLILSIVLLAISLFLLPRALTKQTDDQIQLVTLRDILEKDNMVLPYPTKLCISFSDKPLLRGIIFVFLLAVGLAGEFFIKNKKIGGLIHLVNILIALGMGSYFALSLVLPFTPL
ncbi:MAG: hypothetical protein JRG79_12120 [Deltaproteobacteria bacterium]|nr:hypothetical protein [Deltaproteobacteria bacterium]